MADEREEVHQQQSLEEELEEAKRHFALKEWPQAVNSYAEVLDTMREKHSEEEFIFAPIFHRYGHSLLELAISTSGALGGGGPKEAFLPDPKSTVSAAPSKVSTDKAAGATTTQASSSTAAAAASSSKAVEKVAHDPRFTFGGDAEESEEEQEPSSAANGAEEEEGEDDLSLAFSILEIARVLYEKALSSDEAIKTIEGDEWSSVMIKSQLAEVLNDLADVGLESENFQQASTDYKSSLDILTPLLQSHSRRLADAYLRLGLALEFHPDATLQSSAGKYVTGACTTLEKRLASLQARQRVLQKETETGEIGLARAEAAASALRVEKAEKESEQRLKEEGILQGESKEAIFEKDDVAIMDWDQTEKEIKDVKEMIQELRQKLDDYASNSVISGTNGSSSEIGKSAKDKVQAAINEVLLGSSTNALGAPPLNPNAPVNDLSAMVKRKKKPTSAEEQNGDQGKRKEISEREAEEERNKKLKED